MVLIMVQLVLIYSDNNSYEIKEPSWKPWVVAAIFGIHTTQGTTCHLCVGFLMSVLLWWQLSSQIEPAPPVHHETKV